MAKDTKIEWTDHTFKRAVHLSAVTTTRCVFAKGEEFLGWVQGIQAPTDDLEGAVVY